MATWIPILFELCIFPLLIILTHFAVKWLKAKTVEAQTVVDNDLADKYIGLLSETVSNCVLATTQTYVDSLKKQGRFDEEAQKIAFTMSYEAVLATLNDEAKIYLTNLYGDLETYLGQLIEAEVSRNK